LALDDLPKFSNDSLDLLAVQQRSAPRYKSAATAKNFPPHLSAFARAALFHSPRSLRIHEQQKRPDLPVWPWL
jgi:hypothetical protein